MNEPVQGGDGKACTPAPAPATETAAPQTRGMTTARLVVFSVIVALLCALTLMLKNSGPGCVLPIMKDQVTFARAATQRLGMHLAEKHAGGKALVLTFPAVYGEDLTDDAMLEGLKTGLNGKIEIIVEKIQPDLPSGAKPSDQNADMYAPPWRPGSPPSALTNWSNPISARWI